MIRRDFLKTASFAAAGAYVAVPTYSFPIRQGAVIKPSRLKKGDLLGLVAPGSFITEKELEESVSSLEKLGFKALYTDKILSRDGYFAGSDKIRAEDLQLMFRNKDVKGIVCARGGYGAARILPLLDFNLIKANPKVLVGYSDVTALLCGIWANAGVATFHGPVGISTFNEFSVDSFSRVLIDAEPNYKYSFIFGRDYDDEFGVYQIRGGKAEGILAGGNLSIIASLAGTKYNVDLTDKLVFIEEVGEEPYRIDRMLTQLIQASNLDKAAGIILGIFKNCDIKKKRKESPQISFSLSEVLFDRLFDLGIPVVYGIPFGHVNDKLTIPFGTRALLDADNGEFIYLENAVV